MIGDFSVLMSVYVHDSPVFLEEAVISVINQTIEPKEVILVEDGELSDSLNQKIDSLLTKFKIIKLVKLKKNMGLGEALAKGSNYVTTKYIARMDADDVSINTRFEKQLKYFESDESLGIVGGQVAEFEKDTNNIIQYRTVPISNEKIRKFAKFRSPFNHPSIMIKTSVLRSAGGYKSFGHLEDYYLWMRVLLNKNIKVSNCDETILFMRVDRATFTRRGGVKYLSTYLKFRKMCFHYRFINFYEYIVSCTLMVISALMPNVFRRLLYSIFLRKK